MHTRLGCTIFWYKEYLNSLMRKRPRTAPLWNSLISITTEKSTRLCTRISFNPTVDEKNAKISPGNNINAVCDMTLFSLLPLRDNHSNIWLGFETVHASPCPHKSDLAGPCLQHNRLMG